MVHPGPVPTDPYQWRESVLSTRSLSYISNVCADVGQTLRRKEQTAEQQKGQTSQRDRHSDNSEAAECAGDLPRSITSSPLYKLPLELRQLIWSYALSPSSSGPHFAVPWPSTRLHAHLDPQLLRACRIIYEETAPILYTTTNLCFFHPSDANMFRRALASPDYAYLLPHFTLRLRAADVKLWTAYFNSTSPERSLVRDFPQLKSVTLRYQGLRYDNRYTPAQNVQAWLKDDRLKEVILSVSKCSLGRGADPLVVRVTLSVAMPDEARTFLIQNRADPSWQAGLVIPVRDARQLNCYIGIEVSASGS